MHSTKIPKRHASVEHLINIIRQCYARKYDLCSTESFLTQALDQCPIGYVVQENIEPCLVQMSQSFAHVYDQCCSESCFVPFRRLRASIAHVILSMYKIFLSPLHPQKLVHRQEHRLCFITQDKTPPHAVELSL